MANQRPIRRFKKRFYGLSKKRPFRWAADSNATDTEPVGGEGFLAPVIPNEGLVINQGVPPYATLLSGEFDVQDWADDQEVTVDRIVGTLSVLGNVSIDASAVSSWPFVVVRLGIITQEEASDDPAVADPTRSLFDFGDLQEAEWVWLKQVTLPFNTELLVANGTNVAQVAVDVDVDIKNRRKIGQKDNLLLYASYMHMAGGIAFTWNVRLVHALRIGMMSR